MKRGLTAARRKMLVRALAIALALLLVLGALASVFVAFAQEEGAQGALSQEEGPARDRYTLDLYMMEDANALQISQTVAYVNRAGKALDRVLFALYPNACRRLSSLPLTGGDFEAAAAGFAPAGIELLRVCVNGEIADWAAQGEAEAFLRVSCSLPAGETALFQFDYLLLLPPYAGALGAGELSWRLTNFYPRAARYDEAMDGFVLNAPSALVDAAYADAADYIITVDVPENYLVAGPGAAVREGAGEGRAKVSFEAEGARDAALVLGRRYTQYQGQTASGVMIRALTTTRAGALSATQAAERALARYEAWFGPYPWQELTIVMCECGAQGSQSHTGLILVDESLFSFSQRAALEEAVALHAARQWFSRAVGCDPLAEPWLQSALPAYAALLAYEEEHGYDAYIARLNDLVLDALNVTIPGGLTVDSAATRFSERDEYELIVVRRGLAFLHLLRKSAGREAFLQSLRAFYEDNRLENATVAEFAAAFDETTGTRWDEFILGEMHNIADYAGVGLTWFE